MTVFSTEIILALIAILSNIVTYFLTRRKYNAEVNATTIENMLKSLEFYMQISEDNKRKLDEAFNENRQLREEVSKLRTQLLDMATSICTDLSCKLRLNEDTVFFTKKFHTPRKKSVESLDKEK